MTATLAGVPLSTCRLHVPRYGAATADAQLLDDTALVVGSRATLVLGDRSMVGTIRPGGAFGGSSGFSWIAGGNGWQRTVDRRKTPPHDDNGLLLSAILRDLAADAKEIGAVLDGVPDRQLGRDWTRPLALARDLLDALTPSADMPTGGQWWVADDGATHVGPRPATTFSSTTLTVDPYDPELRRGTIRLADDKLAALVPGCTLTAQGLPAPLLIGSTTVHLEAGSLEVDVWGEKNGAELLTALVSALTAWRAYLRPNPYRVTGVAADGRVAVTPADARSVAFPDAPALPHVAGLPGASYTLAPGSNVVVQHLAGDPGSPVVAGHLPGPLPVSVVLDASGKVQIGGGTGTPLALADPLLAWMSELAVVLAGHGITMPDPPPSMPTTKATGV